MLAATKHTLHLKKLAILAKQNVNNQLSLKRKKDIFFTDKHYLALLLLISLFCTFAEGGGYVANWFGNLPKGDTLLDQLEKFKEEEILDQFQRLFERQFRSIFQTRWRKPKVILAIDMTDKPTHSRWKKTNRNIVGGKPKASTCHFFRFATVQIADKKNPITLYAMHCKKGNTSLS